MKVVLYKGHGVQVDLVDVEDRSDDGIGALHLRKGQKKSLTDDEYAFIIAHRPDVKEDLVLLKDSSKTPKRVLQGKAKKKEPVAQDEDAPKK